MVNDNVANAQFIEDYMNQNNVENTEATTARLTYTGAATTVVKLDFDVSISQASGADRDILISVHRNGIILL